MAKRLTDGEKKKIIADYIECGNLREVARKYNRAPKTVKAVVEADEKTTQKVTEKKEQNVQEVLEYMDSLSDLRKTIISASLNKLCIAIAQDELKPRELIAVYGTLMDKELNIKALKHKITPPKDDNDKVDKLLAEIEKEVKDDT